MLQAGRVDADFRAWDTSGNLISSRSDRYGLSASVEYGRKKLLDGNGWYVEPQTQLSLGRLFGNDAALSNGVRAEQSGVTTLVGRAGFQAGREIGNRKNVYVKLNVLHEFGGDAHTTLRDPAGETLRRDYSFRDTWVEYGFGAAVRANENTHVYFDFERSTGGDVRKKWSWNAGVRYSF